MGDGEWLFGLPGEGEPLFAGYGKGIDGHYAQSGEGKDVNR